MKFKPIAPEWRWFHVEKSAMSTIDIIFDCDSFDGGRWLGERWKRLQAVNSASCRREAYTIIDKAEAAGGKFETD